MVSTAAWACIEFLQGVYHDKRKNHQPCLNSRLGLHWVFTRPMENRASAGLRSVSTAAWACIEFLLCISGKKYREYLAESQQPLGLALSFYNHQGVQKMKLRSGLNSRLGLHWVFTKLHFWKNNCHQIKSLNSRLGLHWVFTLWRNISSVSRFCKSVSAGL